MVGWHHQPDGLEFEQVPGVDDGQGSLAWCSPRGCKDSGMTEWLNWTMPEYKYFPAKTSYTHWLHPYHLEQPLKGISWVTVLSKTLNKTLIHNFHVVCFSLNNLLKLYYYMKVKITTKLCLLQNCDFARKSYLLTRDPNPEASYSFLRGINSKHLVINIFERSEMATIWLRR